MNSIESILDKNEKVLWRGNAELMPYFFSQKAIIFISFRIIWTMISCSFVVISVETVIGAFMSIIGITFTLIGFGMILTPLFRYFSYKNVGVPLQLRE